MTRVLTALPVYNERDYVNGVLDEVARYSQDMLVVDDGSNDGTSELLARRSDIAVVTHPQNRGYGAALLTAFDYAIRHNYEVLVTIDCDGQHEPKRIPHFVRACWENDVDIVSGSRYLAVFAGDTPPPADRRAINVRVTAEVNRRLGLSLTDAFCGFKAYRVSALAKLDLSETGYSMPLEVWVQAAANRLRVMELPVPLIYLDEKRSFGGALDNAETRMEYYRQTLDHSLGQLPVSLHFPERSVEPQASCQALCNEATE